MNYQEYFNLFETILKRDQQQAPYTKPVYLEYVKLNLSRMNRWFKTLELDEKLVSELKQLQDAQKWIILAEPWCGDASPTVPFLIKLSEQNPLIEYDIQLRDSEPFLINDYLTNGSKSIPKLIVRDAAGKDLFTWGPRPKGAQQLFDALRAEHIESQLLSANMQNWYNADKGVELQSELLRLFKTAQKTVSS